MFQLAEETPTHYIVKHPAGDILKIAKSGLSKDMHAHIKKMSTGPSTEKPVQNFSDGTPDEPVQDPEGAADLEAATSDAPQSPVVINVHGGGAERAPAQELAPQLENTPAPAQKVPLPTGTVGEYEKGLQQEAQAQANLGQAEATQAHSEVQKQQEFQNQLAQNLKETHDDLSKIGEDYANQKIDFNRVWANKSAPSKILAGIGMMFSGIGSGLTGQPNMALKVINDEIDRDIKQQMAESDRKRNLYSMHREMHQDDRLAIESQRLGYQALAAAQAKEILSKSKGPIAAAQMLQKSPLVLDMQQRALNLAMEKTKFKILGQLTGQNPQQLTTQPGAPKAQPTTPVNYKSAADLEMSVPNTQQILGRTGQINNNNLTAYQMAGVMPKEDVAEATKEAKAFNEAQETKSMLMRDIGQMSESIQKDRQQISSHSGVGISDLSMRRIQEGLSHLPGVGEMIKESEPAGGEIGRQYAAAKASALDKINTLLSKRIGGEAMKNIAITLPDQSDSDEEIRSKVARIMQLIDTNTATPTLDRYKLIN